MSRRSLIGALRRLLAALSERSRRAQDGRWHRPGTPAAAAQERSLSVIYDPDAQIRRYWVNLASMREVLT